MCYDPDANASGTAIADSVPDTDNAADADTVSIGRPVAAGFEETAQGRGGRAEPGRAAEYGLVREMGGRDLPTGRDATD